MVELFILHILEYGTSHFPLSSQQSLKVVGFDDPLIARVPYDLYEARAAILWSEWMEVPQGLLRHMPQENYKIKKI